MPVGRVFGFWDHSAGRGAFSRGWGGRRPGRFFEKGDLKYVILDLLSEKPRHGYDIIRALEDRFAGWYTPSPGAVYPTLQLLEDLGYVTVTQQDGKKVYAITDAGRAFLRDREAVLEEIVARVRGLWGGAGRAEQAAAWAALREELAEFGRVVGRYGPQAAADPDTLRRLVEALRRARAEVEDILRGTGPATL
ncbi:MAG: PadR family transcriptional regulator [Chloroflexota bacterium]|nr:PadR family transcriptional regulator [Dehalococcoidia bacterium]MDW8253733.1 PadR family transcriptional regulator [Chloroflexota bacterium]